jgi:hypothetical protein
MNSPIASLLAQAAGNDAAVATGVAAAVMAFFAAFALVILAVAVIHVVAMWKVYAKAGQPGWACLIPIYNLYVELRIAGMSPLWLLTLLACGVGYIIPWILCQVKMAQRFGKSTGFALGLIFFNLIFVLILAFGSAQYVAEKPAQA